MGVQPPPLCDRDREGVAGGLAVDVEAGAFRRGDGLLLGERLLFGRITKFRWRHDGGVGDKKTDSCSWERWR